MATSCSLQFSSVSAFSSKASRTRAGQEAAPNCSLSFRPAQKAGWSLTSDVRQQLVKRRDGGDAPRERFFRPVAALAEAATGEAVAGGDMEYGGNDELILFFKAEGALSDSTSSRIYKALEGVEGVSDVTVTTSDAGATVECIKKTTIQATDVASGLVEVIQGAGFKVQMLSLGFDNDDYDDDDILYDYEPSAEESDAPTTESEGASEGEAASA